MALKPAYSPWAPLQQRKCILKNNKWVSELSWINAKGLIFQLYHAKDKFIFDEMMTMITTLY
jgi:hypothetical protein